MILLNKKKKLQIALLTGVSAFAFLVGGISVGSHNLLDLGTHAAIAEGSGGGNGGGGNGNGGGGKAVAAAMMPTAAIMGRAVRADAPTVPVKTRTEKARRPVRPARVMAAASPPGPRKAFRKSNSAG